METLLPTTNQLLQAFYLLPSSKFSLTPSLIIRLIIPTKIDTLTTSLMFEHRKVLYVLFLSPLWVFFRKTACPT